jgi:hypothetical protein
MQRSIKDIKPLMTMVGGKIVYDADAKVTTSRAGSTAAR